MILGLLYKTEKKRALAVQHLTEAKRILSQFGETPILAASRRRSRNSDNSIRYRQLSSARGRLIPFNSNSPTGSTFTAFPTFVNTLGLMRI